MLSESRLTNPHAGAKWAGLTLAERRGHFGETEEGWPRHRSARLPTEGSPRGDHGPPSPSHDTAPCHNMGIGLINSKISQIGLHLPIHEGIWVTRHGRTLVKKA